MFEALTKGVAGTGKRKFLKAGRNFVPFTRLNGKSQAEVNAGVLERIKREKPNLILCTNHDKYDPPQVFHTVQELRQMKANRVTGTRRFKG